MEWREKNKEFNALIKQLFHADDWQERAEAARNLGFLRDARATNLLCRALRNEEDETVINKIIEALGKIGDGRATMRIIEKLKEEVDRYEGDKYRLIYIIEALTRIKDKRALVYIGPFLHSSDDQLRELAETAYDEIQPNWREILKKSKEERSIQDIFDIHL